MCTQTCTYVYIHMQTGIYLHTYIHAKRWDFLVHADVNQVPRDELGVEPRQRLKMQLLKVCFYLRCLGVEPRLKVSPIILSALL